MSSAKRYSFYKYILVWICFYYLQSNKLWSDNKETTKDQ